MGVQILDFRTNGGYMIKRPYTPSQYYGIEFQTPYLREHDESWSPLLLPSLAFWYRGDSAVIDGSGLCAEWRDKSSNGRHLTQTSAAIRPLIIENGYNGRTYLQNNAASRRMSVTFGVGLNNVMTYYVVWKSDGFSAGDLQFAFDGNATNNRNALAITAGGVNVWIAQSAAIQYAKSSPFADFIITTAVFNGGSSAIYEDDVSKVTGNTGSHTLNGLRVFCDYAEARGLNGKIAEIIGVNASVTSTNQSRCHIYLRKYYSAQE